MPVYQVDRAYRTLYYPLPGSYTLETALLSGTYLVDWFVEAFLGKAGEAESQELTLEFVSQVALDDVPPGAGGVVLVPYWNSAMSPYWDAAAAGLVIGWRGYHRREHQLRAIFEGVAYELRLHLEGLESALDRQVDGYIASGGGAQNNGWCQLISDVTGRPVARLLTSAASALGAGIQAACAVGLFPSFEHAAAAMVHLVQNKLLPDPERHTPVL